MNRHPFVAVEGQDGTGKTTLRKGLFRLHEGLFEVTPLAVLTTNFLDPGVALDLVEGKYQPTSGNQYRYLAALASDKQSTADRLVTPALPARPVIADGCSSSSGTVMVKPRGCIRPGQGFHGRGGALPLASFSPSASSPSASGSRLVSARFMALCVAVAALGGAGFLPAWGVYVR
ncbi:hypothetical protein [Streptomyces sp. NPDC000133]|uniref:hypothetical protein n=1 Tax=Streptomyces sp. NPDC000133 TaxID=3364535 RepID=UPI00369408BE